MLTTRRQGWWVGSVATLAVLVVALLSPGLVLRVAALPTGVARIHGYDIDSDSLQARSIATRTWRP
ncbi:MAG: hypothetical protein LC749_18705 [Actinobacteria bacterium]|nr:hypothetical protein [Actinomycetota bacterium]